MRFRSLPLCGVGVVARVATWPRRVHPALSSFGFTNQYVVSIARHIDAYLCGDSFMSHAGCRLTPSIRRLSWLPRTTGTVSVVLHGSSRWQATLSDGADFVWLANLSDSLCKFMVSSSTEVAACR